MMDRVGPGGSSPWGAREITSPTAGTRLQRIRRASLRAIARVHGESEPSPEECDRARWDSGLAGAYRSLGRRRTELEVVAQPEKPSAYRPPFAWVLPVDVAVFAVLLIAASPAALWETRGHLPLPELLGIPDAPGSLLFVVVARAWLLLLTPVMPIEVGLTLFALASTAAAAAASFLLAHRVVWGLGGARWSTPLALAAVLVGVTVLALRSPATMEGGAYWLNGAALIAAAWLVMRWSDRIGHADSPRYLLGAAYLGVIALTSEALWTLPLASAALFAARLVPARLGRWRSPTRSRGGFTPHEATSTDPPAQRDGPEATPRPAPPRPAA